MNEISLEVNGVTYIRFNSISIRKSLTSFCGSFSIVLNTYKPDATFPFKGGERCIVRVDGTRLLTGYIEAIDIQEEGSGAILTSILGREVTCDLLDSTLGEDILNSAQNKTLKKIIESVLAFLSIENIKVIDPYNLPSMNDLVNFNVGVSGFEFIQQYANLQNVLLTTDSYGNIRFFRASDAETLDNVILDTANYRLKTIFTPEEVRVVSTAQVVGTEKIGSFSSHVDLSKRYYKYVYYQQSNVEYFESDKNANGSQVVVYDKGIRKSRVKYFNETASLTKEQIKDRALWEMKYNKTSSFFVSVVLFSFFTSVTNKLWAVGKKVIVRDKIADINASLLISDITYSLSASSISVNIKLVDGEGFTLKAEKLVNNKSSNAPKLFLSNVDKVLKKEIEKVYK